MLLFLLNQADVLEGLLLTLDEFLKLLVGLLLLSQVFNFKGCEYLVGWFLA